MNQKLILVVAMLLVATVAIAQQNPAGQGPTTLNGGITSTPGGFAGSGPDDMNLSPLGLGRHDLQDAVTLQPLGCLTCHLPHTAPTYGRNLLWAWSNMPTTLQTYETFTNPSGQLNKPSTTATYPATLSGNSRSMLCFSCHDGVSMTNNGIAAANTYNGTPYQLVNAVGGTSTQLEAQHPVDAVFPNTTDYVQPISVTSGTIGMYGSSGYVGVDQLPLWNGGSSGLVANSVECATCHDVHNDYPTTGVAPAGGAPFLRVANTNGTYLCRECHAAQ